ncbi:hypothetical protein Droror1_Dr00004235 [Drosera rotundifolia]
MFFMTSGTIFGICYSQQRYSSQVIPKQHLGPFLSSIRFDSTRFRSMAIKLAAATVAPSIKLSPATHQTPTSTSLLRLRRRFLIDTTPPSTTLIRSRSCEFPMIPKFPSLRRTCSVASNSAFFSCSENDDDHNYHDDFEFGMNEFSPLPLQTSSFAKYSESSMIREKDEEDEEEVQFRSEMEFVRNGQWREGLMDASETAYCSIRAAFSSMVFMIRELHGFTIQMRELLYYEDLDEIWERVKKEMHASFVWLFQQVFSCTPTLMVYVMIFLANFTVHSMSNNAAFAAMPRGLVACSESTAIVAVDTSEQRIQKNDQDVPSVMIKSLDLMDGINGGGGNVGSVGNKAEGEGWFEESFNHHQTIVPDGVYQVSTRVDREEEAAREDEERIWNEIVDEAARMQAKTRDESLDVETMTQFVSPVTAEVEEDGNDHEEYLRTEMMYKIGLAQEPNNSLLLGNYAQYLYLVLHDHVRAEDYFKRAVKVEPKDAEALNKYATFLWQAKKDLWAAEETFLDAISAEPDNSYYAANYAHFLWNTGGEDTCYPLDSSDGPLEC